MANSSPDFSRARDWGKARVAARLLRSLQWTDAEIAQALGVSDRALRKWRNRPAPTTPDVPPHQLAILGRRHGPG